MESRKCIEPMKTRICVKVAIFEEKFMQAEPSEFQSSAETNEQLLPWSTVRLKIKKLFEFANTSFNLL